MKNGKVFLKVPVAFKILERKPVRFWVRYNDFIKKRLAKVLKTVHEKRKGTV